VLFRARALAPLRHSEIAFSGIRPETAVVTQHLAELVEHFGSNSDAPASKGFASRSRGSLFFPFGAHGGNFEKVGALDRHGWES
jgi:hypothetical protein